jgi:hypothetical protein
VIPARFVLSALVPAALIPVVAALAVAASGCAGRQRTPELDTEVRAFGDGIRWQKLAEAAARIPLRERADFLAEREELGDDLRIADFEIERIDLHGDGHTASVKVQWTWMLDSRGIVHKTWTEQAWELHGKSWLMVSEERHRGEEMPGVAEADKADATAENP